MVSLLALSVLSVNGQLASPLCVSVRVFADGSFTVPPTSGWGWGGVGRQRSWSSSHMIDSDRCGLAHATSQVRSWRWGEVWWRGTFKKTFLNMFIHRTTLTKDPGLFHPISQVRSGGWGTCSYIIDFLKNCFFENLEGLASEGENGQEDLLKKTGMALRQLMT